MKGNIYWSSFARVCRFNTATKIIDELQIPIGEVYHVFVDHKGNVISDGVEFFSVSTNRGNNWSAALACTDSLYCWSLPDVEEDSSGGIYSVYYGQFFRTTDLGNSWTITSAPLTSNDKFNGVGYPWGHVVITAPNGNIFNCASNHGIARSKDLGNSWDSLTNGLLMNGTQNVFPQAIDCDKSGVLYTFFRYSIYRSTNNGDLWKEMININHPSFFKSNDSTSEVQCIVATPRGEIFAGTSDKGVLMSSDQGLTWKIANEGIESANISLLASNADGDVFGFIGRSLYTKGIVFRPFQGNQWYNANSGLQYTDNLSSISIAPDGTAYLGINGEGVWRSQGIMNAVHSLENISDNIQINVSPNPASSNAKIAYSIPEREFVKIDLCDGLGRTIMTFFKGNQDAGEHLLNIDFPDIANGLYFIRLISLKGVALSEIIIRK